MLYLYWTSLSNKEKICPGLPYAVVSCQISRKIDCQLSRQGCDVITLHDHVTRPHSNVVCPWYAWFPCPYRYNSTPQLSRCRPRHTLPFSGRRCLWRHRTSFRSRAVLSVPGRISPAFVNSARIESSRKCVV